jgi:glycosyltransferase involved in cell wall biosynthesis
MPVLMHLIDSAGVYGAEKVLLELATRTRQRDGWRVLVGSMLAPGDAQDPLGAAAHAAGLEVVTLRLPDGFRPGHFKAIIGQARQAGVELLHAHGFKANIATALQPRSKSRIPVIASLHGSTATSRWSVQGLRSLLESSLLHRQEQVIAVSNSLAGQLRGYVPAGRLAVIGNGITISGPASLPGCLASLESAGDAPLLLAAGRLSHEKGFDVLLQAFATIRREAANARLVVAGDGPLRAALQQQAQELAIEDAVLWAGFVPGLAGIMHAFDCLLLPSRREARPIVVLEAMAQGLPVVATAVGDVPLLLEQGQCGSLVPAQDPAALAAAALHCLGNHQGTAQQTRRAQASVQQNHSGTAMEAAYFDHYNSVLNHNSRPTP